MMHYVTEYEPRDCRAHHLDLPLRHTRDHRLLSSAVEPGEQVSLLLPTLLPVVTAGEHGCPHMWYSSHRLLRCLWKCQRA